MKHVAIIRLVELEAESRLGIVVTIEDRLGPVKRGDLLEEALPSARISMFWRPVWPEEAAAVWAGGLRRSPSPSCYRNGAVPRRVRRLQRVQAGPPLESVLLLKQHGNVRLGLVTSSFAYAVRGRRPRRRADKRETSRHCARLSSRAYRDPKPAMPAPHARKSDKPPVSLVVTNMYDGQCEPNEQINRSVISLDLQRSFDFFGG